MSSPSLQIMYLDNIYGAIYYGLPQNVLAS
jgi:hypothetical protein